jgi:polar amino acid transport system substrate-binding protein
MGRKRMKKIKLVVILVLALNLLYACAHKRGPFFLTSASPVLDRILQRGELRVGTAASMPPLNMTTKAGEIIGLEIDLVETFATAMGVELKLEAMAFHELLPALETGKVDMVISGMTITPKRNLKVAFVGPYFISGKALLTKIETIASVKDPAEIDRRGITLAALRGSTSQIFIEKTVPQAKLVTAEDYDEAITLVIQGQVDALVADFPICVISTLRYPEHGLFSLISPFTYEPLGIAVPASDPLLVNWVDNFLNTLEASGLLEDLTERWFANGSWLSQLP